MVLEFRQLGNEFVQDYINEICGDEPLPLVYRESGVRFGQKPGKGTVQAPPHPV